MVPRLLLNDWLNSQHTFSIYWFESEARIATQKVTSLVTHTLSPFHILKIPPTIQLADYPGIHTYHFLFSTVPCHPCRPSSKTSSNTNQTSPPVPHTTAQTSQQKCSQNTPPNPPLPNLPNPPPPLEGVEVGCQRGGGVGLWG